MKRPERNNRKNPWTHAEDSLLLEMAEITKNRDKKLWVALKELGVNRTYKAVKNRLRYITVTRAPVVDKNIPKGWGVY